MLTKSDIFLSEKDKTRCCGGPADAYWQVKIAASYVMTKEAPEKLPTRFGFLLLEDFSLISMSSAVETLRMANYLTDETIYEWQTISPDGLPARASDGLRISVNHGLADAGLPGQLDAVVVCGGQRVERFASDDVLGWLRKCSMHGMQLGSICTGSYVLAKAGLLDGYQCSTHWENIVSLSESFPAITVNRNIFTIDRDRFTSSGGTASLDMMLHFVARQCGSAVSTGVAEQFVYERIRNPGDLQRVPLKHFDGKHSAKLVAAVELMEANLNRPVGQDQLAAHVGLSRRQLQRLFQKYLLTSPSRYYLQLRLQAARQLLLQTRLSLFAIASKTGFMSRSHFSKAYKEHHGHSPGADRLRAQASAIAHELVEIEQRLEQQVRPLE